MEKQNLLLKFSRIFPSSLSSCQSRALTDVADSSIVITKPNKTPPIENDHSSNLCQMPPKPCRKISTNQLSAILSSDAEGRKCPPVTPASTLYPTKTDRVTKNQSSSSNSGRWFTSSDERLRAAADGFETNTFYSLSSDSGDSLRLKTNSRRFKRCEEMKSIDEGVRSSFASYDTVRSRCSRKMAACCGGEHEPGSDQAATQLYYTSSCRRRREAKSRRKKRRSPNDSVIEEGFAVEKSSSDPYNDFMSSMVEMIVEKQMFGAEDLDRLFFCFLSLNKEDYHGIIFDVFSEICQTLFCN